MGRTRDAGTARRKLGANRVPTLIREETMKAQCSRCKSPATTKVKTRSFGWEDVCEGCAKALRKDRQFVANAGEVLLETPAVSPTQGFWRNARNILKELPLYHGMPVPQYVQANLKNKHARAGEDCVLGSCWEAIGQGIQRLCDGSMGRLDAGTIYNQVLGDTLRHAGLKGRHDV